MQTGRRMQLGLSEGLSWAVLLGALVLGTWIVAGPCGSRPG